VRGLIATARQDREKGIYYAFPFLAGTRPSEQLALLWDDVDFAAGVLRVCRMQERDGSITALTKTEAGTREVPMGTVLKAMLLEWRLVCPRLNGELHRVFPGPGRTEKDGRRVGVGGPLQYQNFRSRLWKKAFERLGLPYISPHAARHQWISTMQAQGIEVGLVAKLAGHANASITLSHYTQAVRNGDAAVKALEDAYALA
jgi:integrase